MAISQLIRRDFGDARDLSGIGGVETGGDAAEFLLLGANSVQARRWLSDQGCMQPRPKGRQLHGKLGTCRHSPAAAGR